MQIVKARSKNTQLSEADYNLAEVRARGHVLIGRLNVIESFGIKEDPVARCFVFVLGFDPQ